VHARTRFTTAALGLALTLSACGAAPGGPAASQSAPADAAVQSATAWIPSTFSSAGSWTTRVDENSPVAAGAAGVAALTGRAITVHDSTTGATLWSSAPVTGTPELSFATDGGKEYLLATYGNGTAEARIDAYLTTRIGDGLAPSSSTRFTAAKKQNVTITRSSHGALVANGDARQVYRPAAAQAVDVPDNAVAMINDATITTDGSTFELKAISGASVWTSAKLKPAGAAAGSQGSYLGVSNGLIAAKWAGADGKDIIAIIRAVNGSVAAVVPSAPGAAGTTLLASADGRWAVYGQKVINAATGASYDLPADVHPVLVDRAVVYSGGEHGNAFDAISQKAITSPKGAPKVVTPLGQGVFFSGTDLTVAQANTLGGKLSR